MCYEINVNVLSCYSKKKSYILLINVPLSHARPQRKRRSKDSKTEQIQSAVVAQRPERPLRGWLRVKSFLGLVKLERPLRGWLRVKSLLGWVKLERPLRGWLKGSCSSVWSNFTLKRLLLFYSVFFSDFLCYVFLKIFINTKCQWDFLMGKNPQFNFKVVMTYKRPTGNSYSNVQR